jgi:hypothetical protein
VFANDDYPDFEQPRGEPAPRRQRDELPSAHSNRGEILRNRSGWDGFLVEGSPTRHWLISIAIGVRMGYDCILTGLA